MSSSLSNNSASEILASGASKRLAGWSGRDDRWRLLLVVAEAPVELEVGWGAGDTSGAVARLSVSRSARLCVYGRNLTVTAANLRDGGTNRIDLVAVDAYEQTRNVLEVSGQGTGAVQSVAVPAFAQDVRLEIEDYNLLSTASIRVKNGAGDVVASYNGDAQPVAGVRLGAAGSLEVQVDAGALWRLVFGLTM